MSPPRPCAAVRLVTTSTDLKHIRALLREYNHHLSHFLPPAILGNREAELAALPGNFVPPLGALFLAVATAAAAEPAGQPVVRPAGCAALRPLPLPGQPPAAEFCRLWVPPRARGLALGQLLLRTAIDHARAAGCATLLLNSVPTHMAAAQVLYQRAGFRPTAPYKPVPIDGIQYFRLDLYPDLQADLHP